MLKKPFTDSHIMRRTALFALAAAMALVMAACAEEAVTPTDSMSPSPSMTVSDVPTPTPTPSPTIVPTAAPTTAPTPSPTPEVSFPPMETTSAGEYEYPQVVADKTSALTNEPVYFKIITSDKVNKLQTVIDGETGKVYTDYASEGGLRVWQTQIHFTAGGNRKVQYKCTTDTGGTVTIPKNPIKISVTFNYTADSTSKTISSGKTVTFTLKTPSSTDYIYVLVDGVNQNIKYSQPDSDEEGVKIWKLNVTFFKQGTREVTFNAYEGTKVKKTFPDIAIPIIVQ